MVEQRHRTHIARFCRHRFTHQFGLHAISVLGGPGPIATPNSELTLSQVPDIYSLLSDRELVSEYENEITPRPHPPLTSLFREVICLNLTDETLDK